MVDFVLHDARIEVFVAPFLFLARAIAETDGYRAGAGDGHENVWEAEASLFGNLLFRAFPDDHGVDESGHPAMEDGEADAERLSYLRSRDADSFRFLHRFLHVAEELQDAFRHARNRPRLRAEKGIRVPCEDEENGDGGHGSKLAHNESRQPCPALQFFV